MSAMEKHVRELVELVASGDYETVAKKSGGVQLSAEDLREAVEEYGFALAPPGEGWWETVDVIPIDGSDPQSFAVAAPLWEPDGESELTLELELIEVEEGKFKTEVNNLHVLKRGVCRKPLSGGTGVRRPAAISRTRARASAAT